MPADFSLLEATAEQVKKALAKGRISARELTAAYLERVSALDNKLKAFIALNPQALKRADQLDSLAARGKWAGPLHGLPVVIKDNIDMPGLPTTAGSIVLARAHPKASAPAVERLAAAGAVIFAKTNLSEFSMSLGWSGHGSLRGQTINPYNRARCVSGSSSGSAAALAANLSLLALGTDTSGSARFPAAMAGVVGFRPSSGSVPSAGVVPVTFSTDIVGPMARSVADAVLLLGVLQGVQSPVRLSPGGLRGARLGVARRFAGACPEVDGRLESALASLRQAGAELIDPVDIPDPVYFGERVMDQVILAELPQAMASYLAGLHPGSPANLENLVCRLKKAASRPGQQTADQGVNPRLIELLEKSLTYTPPSNLATRRQEYCGLIDNIFESNRLEALIYPTKACLAKMQYDRSDPDRICETDEPYRACAMAALTGRPALTVPAGFSAAGLPVGLEFMGFRGGDYALAGLAHDYEQTTGHRRPPGDFN